MVSIEKDEFVKSFVGTEHDEFLKFISEVDKDSRWLICPLKEIKFKTAAETAAEDLFIGSEDAYRDTLYSPLPLIGVLPGGKEVCFRSYLWKQVKQLHRIAAPIITDMMKEGALGAAVEMVNMCGPFLKGDAQVLLRGGKVSGYASEYNANWTETEQLSFIEDSFMKRFPDYEFTGGSFSHEMTTADYRLGETIAEALDKDSAVLSSYAKAWEDAGMDGDLQQAVPMIRFVTGESGLTSIILKPFLVLNGKEIPVSPSLAVSHRGTDKTVWGRLGDFPAESLSMFQLGLAGIETLCNLQVYHPYACMTHALRTFVNFLPRTMLDDVAESFKVFFDPSDPTKTCKAIDVFSQINECIHGIMPTLSAMRKLQAQELIARLVVMDWKKMDVSKAIRLRSCKAKETESLFEAA